ncbi:dTDP-4-dehydrorhamnose reductase [Rickettsiales bacterium]|nr:dTDP-4-dehydrorhamnose reductase [Rickettsiales bacterium]
MIKNIIIFGKNGQVASDLLNIFSKKQQFNIINYSSKDIDFSDLDAVKKFLPLLPKADLIINATAYNAVDLAEDEQEKADNINHKAVALIAKYCQKNFVKFIHYSTNYVFDGKGKAPYKEDNIDNLKPLGIYGKSKLNGEKAIIKSDCDYLIFRVATVYNLNQENNFVAKIRKLAKENKELKIVNDQICNPINSYDIAKNSIKIIEQLNQKSKFKQIYHLTSKKAISYYDFAKKITGDIDDIEITSVTTDHFPTKAKRPLNGTLNCNKLKRDFGIAIQNNYKDVTIILVAYNSAHIIGEALKNIVNRGYRIIIVDNGSNDNLEQYLQDNFKGTGIKLINLENNIGFGRANNLALEDVVTNYAFLLNPDAIISEESLDNLVNEANKDKKIALANPLLSNYFKPNKLQKTEAINYCKNNCRILSEDNLTLQTNLISGGYMLLKMNIFNKIGFFDKNIFLYAEDHELSNRSINNGYKNIIVKNSFIYHIEQSSTKLSSKKDQYKMLYFRNWHIGWGKSYLERKKKSDIKVFIKSIQKILSSLLYVALFDQKNAIKYYSVACGMISNLIGIDCFKKDIKSNSNNIKSQLIL